MSDLKKYYQETIVPALQKELGYTNVMQVPSILKITLNMGVGEAAKDKKFLQHAIEELKDIAGQKVIKTLARKSIAGFKIREGWPLGCKVTLRRARMYDFLKRLLSVALPRVRDFRGLPLRAFDGQGNYSLGISEQIVFPEIQYEKIDVLRGLDITITTTARNNAEGLALLKAFRFPFQHQS